MKRNLLKKFICLLGMLFLAIPAWSAVPANLIPVDRNWSQAPTVVDIADSTFESDIILARGGGGDGGGAGGGGGAGVSGGGQQSGFGFGQSTGTQSQRQTQTQEHIRTQTRTQTESQVQMREGRVENHL